ncbi:class I SAM-dependent methyltransferase [Agrobacterium tumefaciens]|uniref:Methyltransferase domain-containing protein n=1 Tax=Agrobacterium tumefaciens TaxID=358 RepID=A0AA44FA59_AGRTU|nr:class I SAM-dependent methyltransferase [Agrobacterium tumefaciens]NTB87730.1 methyltransferase domain-containing protein [Agrobacterium tumefaciens]NTC32047.1 methyltransferase domain-containing protein [Agrobacterium tumefaciens]
MQEAAVFDKIAYQYDDNRGGEERGNRFAEHILPLLDRDTRVLELGVGTGVVAAAIEKANVNIIGIDASSEMLKRAEKRVSHLVWSDMNKLPFLHEYFGGVYAVWALHLSESVPQMLKEIRRVLKPSGCFLNCSAVNRDLVEVNDTAEKIVWEMHSALAGAELTVDGPHQLEALAPEAGYRFERVVDIKREYEITPNELALHIERRGMSILQQATEAQVRDIINPTIEALRALPDEKLRRHRVHQISVLRAI